jgi:hypothetical protein
MKSRRGITLGILAVVLAFAFVGSLAFADTFDQSMKLTFGQPIAIPGQVLPAGTYWFVRAPGTNQPNILQVFDGDRKNVIATINTGAEQIVKASGHITLTLADLSPKQPQALLSIVYPGRTDGHSFELSYSDQVQRQLSEFPKVTMKVGEKGVVEVETTAGM